MDEKYRITVTPLSPQYGEERTFTCESFVLSSLRPAEKIVNKKGAMESVVAFCGTEVAACIMNIQEGVKKDKELMDEMLFEMFKGLITEKKIITGVEIKPEAKV